MFNRAWKEVLRGWTFIGVSAAALLLLVLQFELRHDALRLAILEGAFGGKAEQSAPTSEASEAASTTEKSDIDPALIDEPAAPLDPEATEFSETETSEPAEPTEPCTILKDGGLIKDQRLNRFAQREVEVSQPTTVYAPITGTIVKLYESPNTGLTAYIVSKDELTCYALGGFQNVQESIKQGKMINCGSEMGEVTHILYLDHYKIPPGTSWWKGERTAPAAL